MVLNAPWLPPLKADLKLTRFFLKISFNKTRQWRHTPSVQTKKFKGNVDELNVYATFKFRLDQHRHIKEQTFKFPQYAATIKLI